MRLNRQDRRTIATFAMMLYVSDRERSHPESGLVYVEQAKAAFCGIMEELDSQCGPCDDD